MCYFGHIWTSVNSVNSKECSVDLKHVQGVGLPNLADRTFLVPLLITYVVMHSSIVNRPYFLSIFHSMAGRLQNKGNLGKLKLFFY